MSANRDEVELLTIDELAKRLKKTIPEVKEMVSRNLFAYTGAARDGTPLFELRRIRPQAAANPTPPCPTFNLAQAAHEFALNVTDLHRQTEAIGFKGPQFTERQIMAAVSADQSKRLRAVTDKAETLASRVLALESFARDAGEWMARTTAKTNHFERKQLTEQL